MLHQSKENYKCSSKAKKIKKSYDQDFFYYLNRAGDFGKSRVKTKAENN